MRSNRQFGKAELELAEGLRAADRKKEDLDGYSTCPTNVELLRFARGMYGKDDATEMLAHLGRCLRCAERIEKLRNKRVKRRRASLIFALAAAIAILVWIKVPFSPSVPAGVATIDLRQFAPTRGTEASTADAIQIARSSETFRLVLPIGSEGYYECEIHPTGKGSALLKASGEAVLKNQDVVLNVNFNSKSLRPGKYTIALRRSGSEWVYYSAEFK